MTELPRKLLLWLALGVAAGFVLSLIVGHGRIGFGGDAEARALILREIRLPRAVLGALVGAALGMAGAALQGFLRNPLAEPGIIGVSGGAALGAVLAIHLGLAQLFPAALPLAGLVGAAIATLLVVALAGESTGPVPLMLAGVAISSLTSALIALALNLSSNPFAAAESVVWMMGSLTDRSLTHVAFAGPLIAGGLYLLIGLGRTLDALTLGDEAAASLGIDLNAARQRLVAGIALAIGAATAVTGIIGFVGLVVPHVLRPYVGNRPSHLLPASALGGAILVLLADAALRFASPWIDVRIGVLTAILGAPFFIALVLRLRQELVP